MTREELAAAVEVVLDAPRTSPDRLSTVMAAVDHYTARAEAAAFDRGYGTGHGDAEDEAEFHERAAEEIAAREQTTP